MRRSLAGQQLATVATWVYLKSLVIQMTTAPDVTSAHYYHDLFATHGSRPNTLVWLGALNGIDAGTGFFVGAQIHVEHQGAVHSGYLATVGIGAFAARLAVPGAIEGFYVVGSAALGAFQPGRSDVDFVAASAWWR